jgi:hypothetical protein
LNDAEVWSKPPRKETRRGRRTYKGPAFVKYQSSDPQSKKVLVERFINNYEKFNSNSGWVNQGFGQHKVLTAAICAAISHFSYHVSAGQYLLCDLQGSSCKDNGIILSDVVINSREVGRHGPSDLGPQGISTFFSQHVCGHLCSRQWTRPKDQKKYLPVQSDTSMSVNQYDSSRMNIGETIYEDDSDDDEYYY